MGLYKQKGSLKWWVQYKGVRESTGTESKKLAEKKLRELQYRVDHADLFPEKVKTPFNQVCNRYISDVLPGHTPLSQRREKGLIVRFQEYFGSMPIQDMTKASITKYKEDRLKAIMKNGKVIKPDSVRKELGLLRQIWYACRDRWEYVDGHCPVTAVIKTLPKQVERCRLLAPDEAEKLRFCIPAHLKPIVAVALQTGLRLRNVVLMEKAWVKWDVSRIIIPATSFKGKRTHAVKMTSVVRSILEERRNVPGNYFFSEDAGKPYDPDKISVQYQRAVKKAGLTDLRFHDLRHDLATLMLRKTKNLSAVQAALGHKDPRMTNRYAHFLPDDLDLAFDAVDGEGNVRELFGT